MGFHSHRRSGLFLFFGFRLSFLSSRFSCVGFVFRWFSGSGRWRLWQLRRRRFCYREVEASTALPRRLLLPGGGGFVSTAVVGLCSRWVVAPLVSPSSVSFSLVQFFIPFLLDLWVGASKSLCLLIYHLKPLHGSRRWWIDCRRLFARVIS